MAATEQAPRGPRTISGWPRPGVRSLHLVLDRGTDHVAARGLAWLAVAGASGVLDSVVVRAPSVDALTLEEAEARERRGI